MNGGQKHRCPDFKGIETNKRRRSIQPPPETSMPWFQRDWDPICSFYCAKQLPKHRCPDFKGIETISSTLLPSVSAETSMPWFQRDWDKTSYAGLNAASRNIDALISKGLRPVSMRHLDAAFRKHRCPDFKGIETHLSHM